MGDPTGPWTAARDVVQRAEREIDKSVRYAAQGKGAPMPEVEAVPGGAFGTNFPGTTAGSSFSISGDLPTEGRRFLAMVDAEFSGTIPSGYMAQVRYEVTIGGLTARGSTWVTEFMRDLPTLTVPSLGDLDLTMSGDIDSGATLYTGAINVHVQWIYL